MNDDLKKLADALGKFTDVQVVANYNLDMSVHDFEARMLREARGVRYLCWLERLRARVWQLGLWTLYKKGGIVRISVPDWNALVMYLDTVDGEYESRAGSSSITGPEVPLDGTDIGDVGTGDTRGSI